MREFLLHVLRDVLKVHRRQMLARPPRLRLCTAQNHVAQLRRPAAFRFSQRSGEHLHHGIRQCEVVIGPQVFQFLDGHLMAHQKQRQVAHHLA